MLKPSSVVSLTVSNATISLPAPPTDVVSGILTVETANVRMKWDGTDPAAGVLGGLKMPQDSIWEVNGRDLFVAMRFFRDAGDDALVRVAYMKGE